MRNGLKRRGVSAAGLPPAAGGFLLGPCAAFISPPTPRIMEYRSTRPQIAIPRGVYTIDSLALTVRYRILMKPPAKPVVSGRPLEAAMVIGCPGRTAITAGSTTE